MKGVYNKINKNKIIYKNFDSSLIYSVINYNIAKQQLEVVYLTESSPVIFTNVTLDEFYNINSDIDEFMKVIEKNKMKCEF